MTWEGLSPPYRTIVADPPWPMVAKSRPWRIGKGGRRFRATVVPYSVMDLAEIAALTVGELVTENAHLYLWAPALFHAGSSAAVNVAEAWGFKRVGDIVWRKPNYGLGAFPRLQHEFLLVCRRGSLPFVPRNVGSVLDWPSPRDNANNGAKIHSAKPPAALDLVEAASPGPYVELFARQPRFGWDSWGWGYENAQVPS